MITRLALPTLALALLTGCTVSVGGPAPTAAGPAGTAPAPATSAPSAPATSAPSAPATSAPSAPATSAPSAPATAPAEARTWTHGLVDSATRRADATSTQIKGTTTTFPNSTSLWVGCDGTTDEVTLALGGKYRKLHGQLGLRADAPAGLVVHTLVLVDGKPVQNVQLDSDDPGAVAVDAVVTGARTVTFQSKAVAGECSPAEESYAVLGDGYVA
ncbi:hypothetical protein G7070_04890 [Propioniciclava coleopterorum]|uniref:NPCBM/NEW2 domain-containing protein n=1 Tax=Propioniciclava coleopterorum TaxID=2714937 RepID=A0A6G7Y528_9ACTN|nr:hypothetical protein [Propioniciclava coleopterorum]QIK71731.1 hypothetical protein G7070_04890 [Propioniciclava coleopterorum]